MSQNTLPSFSSDNFAQRQIMLNGISHGICTSGLIKICHDWLVKAGKTVTNVTAKVTIGYRLSYECYKCCEARCPLSLVITLH
jgi:hypothetical protein